jgi:hypothetical protein
MGGTTETRTSRLAESGDANHFYDWRLFLPLSKCSGLCMNCICANKSLTVIVKHSDLPVMVLSAFVFESWAFHTSFHSRVSL